MSGKKSTMKEPKPHKPQPKDMPGTGIAKKGAETVAAYKKKRKAILDNL